MLKPNTLGKRFVPSDKNNSIFVCFVCGKNDHLNYACTYRNINIKSLNKWVVIRRDNFKLSITFCVCCVLFILMKRVHVPQKAHPHDNLSHI